MNNQFNGPAIDLSKLGKAKQTDLPPKFSDLVIGKFKQHDRELQQIIMTLGVIWDHIAAMCIRLDIDPQKMADLVTNTEVNEKWLAESAEAEVKIRDIKAMFNEQQSKAAGPGGQEETKAEETPAGEAPVEKQGDNVQGEIPQGDGHTVPDETGAADQGGTEA